MSLEGKVAIVTGAGGGIGLATAIRLGREGASVVLALRRLEGAEAHLAAVRAGGAPEALALECDVSDEAAVAACCEATMRRFGRLDIIVNNAGLMNFRPLAELTGADWLAVLGVDLLGAAFFTGEALRRMGRGGAIVNIASVHAVETTADVAPYAAAKAGMLSLTRSAAIEGRPLGIRANAILPGAVETKMLRDNPNVASGAEALDAADIGRPEDVAAAVAFLASEDAAFVTGATLAVDGGRLARL
ncbi:MAG: SDR family oxidoreductase [Roseococcus sp.]|nr:SDR family oxidoreductase [Roseococcus sp.]